MSAAVLCGNCTSPCRLKPTDSRYCEERFIELFLVFVVVIHVANYRSRGRQSHLDDLGIFRVGLSHDALRARISEETVVYK